MCLMAGWPTSPKWRARSGVGFELAERPAADGAAIEEALAGGDDYVLVFTMRQGRRTWARPFLAAGAARAAT